MRPVHEIPGPRCRRWLSLRMRRRWSTLDRGVARGLQKRGDGEQQVGGTVVVGKQERHENSGSALHELIMLLLGREPGMI